LDSNNCHINVDELFNAIKNCCLQTVNVFFILFNLWDLLFRNVKPRIAFNKVNPSSVLSKYTCSDYYLWNAITAKYKSIKN